MQRALPFLFVFLWSTGFIGAKFGLPHAAPLSFLLARYGWVILLMSALALLQRAPWPKTLAQAGHIAITGLLVHAVYLGGVFMAIKAGLPAGITALIVGMQPVLTALAAGPLLGERILRLQWAGLLIGFLGVLLVVSGKLTGANLALGPMLIPALAALFGITAGTLYQKRHCPSFDLRTGSILQFSAAAILTAPWAISVEGFQIDWTPDFLFALAWLVIVLSLGAISLLNLLIRQGSAVNVASLFYLTPPTTAVIAWLLFDETLSLTASIGMLLAATGVYLVAKRR